MTSSKKYLKPQYKTEKVLLDNGQTVQVGRCSLANLEFLLDIQDRLIQRYVECDGAIGLLFRDEDVISDLTNACLLLPIVGKEGEYLNYEDICENWEQLIVLFFNGGLNQDTRFTDNLLPSKISQLHFLPYAEILKKYAEEAREKRTASSK